MVLQINVISRGVVDYNTGAWFHQLRVMADFPPVILPCGLS